MGISMGIVEEDSRNMQVYAQEGSGYISGHDNTHSMVCTEEWVYLIVFRCREVGIFDERIGMHY